MKKEQTQTKRNHQSKEEEATRQETKRKKQQAQTERSHRRKEEEATRNRFMGGFCEENTRDKKKAREQNASTNTKRTESHTFKGASRKPQLKDCKLKQDASTKQKKKTRHEIDLRGFSHEAAQTKRNHQSKEEEATRKEAKMKEQQAQAKRSHQREKKKKPHEIALWGVLRGKYQ